MANLRRLRLHLRTVRSGDTRSILLQPMGRMERTDSRPRNALIHRESGSPPDYLHTPGSGVSTSAHISVRAASRLRRSNPALRARTYAQLHKSRGTSGVYAGYICLLRATTWNLWEKRKVWWGHGSSLAPLQFGVRVRTHHQEQEAETDPCRTDVMVKERKHCRHSAPSPFTWA